MIFFSGFRVPIGMLVSPTQNYTVLTEIEINKYAELSLAGVLGVL